MINLKKLYANGTPAARQDQSAASNIFKSLFGGNVKAGVRVDADTAEAHTTVMSCYRVLSESIASMPIHIMERKRVKDKFHKLKAYDHKLYNMINLKPNEEMTSFSFIEAMMMNCVSRGNAFAQIVKTKRGDISGIYPLLSDNMQIMRSESGKLGYVYDHYKHGKVWLEKSEVIHVVGMSFDGINGLSPIAYSAASIGLSIAMEQFGSNFFENGANVGGVYEIPTKLSDDAFERLRASLKEKYEGLKKSGKPMLLEEGLSFKKLGVSNNDSQFLESRKFQKSEIASIFRVPPHLINDLDRATFGNIEQQSLEFATYTLLPWVQRFEQAFNIALFGDDTQHYISFNMDAILRGDTGSRYEAYGKAIDKGWMTRNEARELEGRNPIDGLDEPLVPLNMTDGRKTEDE